MIEIIRTTNQFEAFRESLPEGRIGFVPTMGNLHSGHISLVKESLRQNKNTIVSIFVNPKQFGPNEDFDKYPRTLGIDNQKLKELYKEDEFRGKVLAIFAPENTREIFPFGYSTNITVSGLTGKLCGLNRPEHFEGVTTVVYKLLNLVKPHKAYFGQKDYQQYLVIKKMVEDLKINVQLVPMPIKRDEDGLALSSRNRYLSKEERSSALILPQTLQKIKKIIKEGHWPESLDMALEAIEEAKKLRDWEYLEILDSKDLKMPTEKTIVLLLAGSLKAGKTRLIDNKLVEVRYAR